MKKNFIISGTSAIDNNDNNRELRTVFSDAKAVGKNIEKMAVAIRTALKMFEVPADSEEGFYIYCVDAVATLMAEISDYDGWNNPIPETMNHEYWLCYYEFCEHNNIFRYLCKATGSNATFRDSVNLFKLMAKYNCLNQFERYNVEDVCAGLKETETKQKIRELLKNMYEHFKSEGVTYFGFEPTDKEQIDTEDILQMIKSI
jgi:hypothetical protein